jgi:hypothetical protein
MAKQGNQQKFGRHSRNPSSKLQAMRSTRNARINQEKNPKSCAQPNFGDMTKDNDKVKYAGQRKREINVYTRVMRTSLSPLGYAPMGRGGRS